MNNMYNTNFPILEYDELFPDEDDVDYISQKQKINEVYDMFSISVFDHWLSQEEYKKYPVMCYSDIKKKPEEYGFIYRNYENKFIKFYTLLFDNCVICDQNMNNVYQTISHDTYLKLVKESIKEIKFHTFLVDSLGIMVHGNYDLTHIVHANKKSYNKEKFEKIVSDSGLFILK